jgi:hypothetical protein
MVLGLLQSTFERGVQPMQFVVAKSQQLLTGHVHPVFGNGLFFAFTILTAVAIAMLVLRQRLFARKWVCAPQHRLSRRSRGTDRIAYL